MIRKAIVNRNHLLPAALLCCGFSLGASHGAAQDHHHPDSLTTERLGTVSFPTSCAREVQPVFDRGVALLHSFGYRAAQKQFEEIEKKNPGCAMAYWGDAMTLYHQLWDRPSDADLKRGWGLLQKARASGQPTERERGYIAAATAFFQDGPRATFDTRTADYSHLLERLTVRYPDDHEARIFYALSLLASPHADDNDFAYRKKAVDILNEVLKDEPDHPGVAHYLIHACDNPEMAREGLPAAQRYAQIAPASAHALHMPSHIFARLGLWQDDIDSNLLSEAAAIKQKSTHDRVHAMDFLGYAYLQTGQNGKAKAIEEEALAIPKQDYAPEMAGYFYYAQTHFPILFALETRDWKSTEELKPRPDAGYDFQALVYWAQAVAAGHLHDAGIARSAAARYDEALEGVKKSSYAYVADQMVTSRKEAHAWLAFAEGRGNEATHLLSEAADQQDKTGKGEVDLPAREMLADMLLELQRPAEALVQYERSLKTDPNRLQALQGAEKATEALHLSKRRSQ